MRTIYIIDPHTSDFVFIPFFWWLFKKKSLLKYKYFQSLLFDQNIRIIFIITKKHSSLPNRIFHRLPIFFQNVLLRLEIYFWIRQNKLQSVPVVFDNIWSVYGDENCVFFAFGYKTFNSLLLLSKRFHKDCRFFIHLSHYHTFPGEYDLGQHKNIFLCADNDCGQANFFMRKFKNYFKPIIVIPFYVKDVFFQYKYEDERQDKVLITGTYHNIEVNQSTLDFGIYNSIGNLCLHPDRFTALSLSNNSMIEFRVSEYGGKVNKQKDYFKVPFSDLYKTFRFAYVPGEGTGLIAIGTLEAYCSGCKVFMRRSEMEGLGFPKGNIIPIDDIEQFEIILGNLGDFKETDFFDMSWAEKFNYENLSKRIKSLLVERNFVSEYY
jgi:hypothetical protein